MKDVVIETARLRLEPFTEKHLSEKYVGWLGDPEVTKWSENRFRTHTLESCREYWKSFEGSPHLFYAVISKEGDLGHFGNLNVYVDTRHSVADIGILVGDRRVWGKGYGGEAWRAMTEHLLAHGIRKVTGGCVADNVAMVKIFESAGMREEAVRKRHYVYDGREVDLVYYARFGT